MEPQPLTAVVLAGGASRRMGRDKALLEVDGEPLVVRLGRRLEAVCDQVLVASGDGARLPGLPWRQLPDAAADGGPLAGIVAALEQAPTELVAVVAVDMPFADPQVLRLLADRWRGEPAVVPLVHGRVEPLHGVYATAAAGALRAVLESGRRSVVHAISAVGARVVGPDVWGELDPDGRFALNVNRPEDLAGIAG